MTYRVAKERNGDTAHHVPALQERATVLVLCSQRNVNYCHVRLDTVAKPVHSN